MESANAEILINKKLPLTERIKKKLLEWIRLTNDPVVKVYHGYGNSTQLIVFGHVFTVSPLPRRKYRQNIWTNTFSLLRSFMVRTKSDATVRLNWKDTLYKVKTAKDGFFRFELPAGDHAQPGSFKVTVELVDVTTTSENVLASGSGTILVPPPNPYVFVSDIDDTFLISHSSNLRRRLYVLLTKNAHTRRPFEGVVNHYRLLSKTGAGPNSVNPFFYVSSSEWNLYDFIVEFSRKNSLPEGVFLLNQVKQLSQVWKTGQNNHSTKFMRIARIIEAYPSLQYVLLGDDSQQDPYIYAALVEHFPGKIRSVYLRHVFEKNVSDVEKLKQKIESFGVPCCHFQHSAEAIEHSINIGLI